MTHIPPSPVGDTPASTKAEGFLLLTIPNTTITSTSPTYPIPQPLTGLLSIECVTLAVADPLERDVWLVLRIEPAAGSHQAGFELPLPATQKLILSRTQRRYTIPIIAGGGELVLTLPFAATAAQIEDGETLEVILSQYAVIQIQNDPPSVTGLVNTPTPTAGYDADGDLKGRLVLVDEDNGQVVGTLDDQFQIQEDAAVRAEGREKDPVIVEIPEQDQVPGQQNWGRNEDGSPRVRKTIFVHPIAADDGDWMSKTAGLLGRGIVGATNMISSGVTTASNYYISHSKPAAEPMVFSENTKRNVKRVHNISGKAVKVTAITTGLIHQTVERLADKVAGVKSPPPPLQHGHAASGVPYAQGTPVASPGPGSRGWSSPYPGTPAAPATPGTPSTATNAGGRPPLPPRRRFLNRLLTSTDLLLTTVEQSAHHLIGHASTSASAVAHHKYGGDMGNAVGMVGDSVRNVGVVYIDARGVGRRALLRVAGKRILKAKMGGREVVFQEQGMGRGQILVNQQSPSPGGSNVATPAGYGSPPPYPPPGQPPYQAYKGGQ
ncbi:hypothetical protein FRC17_006883 [Serendipita sp. 399]|nr:hypothetical protein FRC17_006883 [Serendipita sp. 399]